MNAKELAEKLNGMEYGDFPNGIRGEAQINKLVIVYGASDDLMELIGAISEEEGAWNGTTIKITKDGILEPPYDEGCINPCKKTKAAYESAKQIKAIWNNKGISWTYETDIPHETFNIMEYGEVYCRGIVFSIEDLEVSEVGKPVIIDKETAWKNLVAALNAYSEFVLEKDYIFWELVNQMEDQKEGE